MSPDGVRTLGDELDWATRSLAEVGIDTARLDAEVLLAHVLGIDRGTLLVRRDDPVNSDVRTSYLAIVSRRAGHEPVAYITGRRGFRLLELAVDPRVLIPRPETEHLVEAAVALIPAGARVADVGTGSGAIALALASERPDLRVTGLDISAAALSLAQLNAARLRLTVDWVRADLLDDGRYDAVAANLPYVAADDLLPPVVARFEPPPALLGGEDGLDVIRRLLVQLVDRPSVRTVLLEIGSGQGAAAADLVRAAGFDEVAVSQDYAGLDRVVSGVRS